MNDSKIRTHACIIPNRESGSSAARTGAEAEAGASAEAEAGAEVEAGASAGAEAGAEAEAGVPIGRWQSRSAVELEGRVLGGPARGPRGGSPAALG